MNKINLENYKKYLDINYNSTKTIANYYNYVRLFSEFSKGEISKELVEDFILDVKNRNKSQCAINLFIFAIKKYIESQELDIKVPKTKDPKTKNKIRAHINEKDLEKVINNITVLFPKDYREREFVLYMMFYTGMRTSEIMNIKGEDIDFKTKEIIVKDGKGEKDRYIPFMNKKLANMLYERRESNYLCTLSADQIRASMKKIQKFLKIKESLEPRTMRRSFAFYCLEKGLNLYELQDLMGHESIDTTQIYSKPNKQKIKDKCKQIMEE